MFHDDKMELTINNFYIFNSTFGAKEGEEDKKIFFFYPSKVDINKQIKIVGLSEAIIKFTSNFVCEEECKSVHTLKTRQYLYQPEPNYWMVMTMNVPCSKSKNGPNDMTYNSENIHDDVYHSLLKQAYDMYNLFLGDFHSFVENGWDTTNLKLKLHQFFTRYINSMKISNCDIVDVFQGMQFLPLDKRTYLHAQSFMNQFQCEFGEQVEFSALLVKQHLVWCNLEMASLRVIYRYLITNLLAPYISENNDRELSAGNAIASNNSFVSEIDESSNRSRFITCAPFYYNNANSAAEKIPKIFVKNAGKDAVYQLLVYNVLSSYMCIFVPETVELTVEFLRSIDNFLKIKLMTIASELALHMEKKRSLMKTNVSSNGNPYCYVYFNRLNLAQKNTLRDKNNTPSEVLSLLADLCFDKKRNSSSGETIVKTNDDFWVIGQFCNEREFYVVSQQKNSTLMDIDDEMIKICEKTLKSIYFFV